MRKKWLCVMLAVVMLTSMPGLGGAQVSSEGAGEPNRFRFDFGPGLEENGYVKVACNEVYTTAKGYGFATAVDGRDRSQQFNAMLRDFCNHGSVIQFQVDVPDGWYAINLIMGDEIATQAATTVTAEGEVVLSGVSSPAGRYIDETFYIRVSDGQLNLRLTGSTVRINGLHIDPVWRLDFGPGPQAAGYDGVGCDQPYAAGVGYGWIGAMPEGADQTGSDALLRDYCYGSGLQFQVDVPNDAYQITLMSGDALAETVMTVRAEGQDVIVIEEDAGSYSEAVFDVAVADGRLDLEWIGAPARVNGIIIERHISLEEAEWPVQQGIEVVDHGASVTLTNSEISFTLTKSNARISTLRKKGEFQDTNLLGGQGGYYHLNYVQDGVSRTFGGSGMVYSLLEHSPERAVVAVSAADPERLQYEMEYRFVLEADTPGIYIYSIFRYPDTMPGGVEIEQSRYSFRLNPVHFNQYAIEDDSKGDRLGAFPRPQDISAGTTLMDATTRLPNGEVYTKYNHSVHIGDNRVNGVFGPRLGVSVIRPSTEYLVGGPGKQEYFVEQTTTTPMVHWYEQVRHFGVPNIVPEHGWEKLYGPFFVYVNEGDGAAEMWSDVKQRTEAEQAKWPYAWLNDPLYDAAGRGEVQGQLVLTDGSSSEGAWVILGQPDRNVYEQNLDYLYYAKADGQGVFRIPHVRPGSYTLYAYVDGVFGEYRLDGVEVLAGQQVNLGQAVWTPVSHGELLWQIGTPDRSPREFKYGDQLRQWGLWLQYPLDFPDDVDFVIGQSLESEDWNYFHPNIKTPGSADHLLVPRDTTAAEWRIRFQLDREYEGEGMLTVGIAASSRGTLNVKLNGMDIYTSEGFVTPLEQDAALYRSGEGGYYHLLEIPFNASLLETGENIVTLKHAQQLSGSTVGIKYDAIRMEAKAAADPTPVSVEMLRELTSAYGAEGELRHPLLTLLNNHLNQVRHHLQAGRMGQAAHHLGLYMQQLDQASMQRHVEADAKAHLNHTAEELLAALVSE